MHRSNASCHVLGQEASGTTILCSMRESPNKVRYTRVCALDRREIKRKKINKREKKASWNSWHNWIGRIHNKHYTMVLQSDRGIIGKNSISAHLKLVFILKASLLVLFCPLNTSHFKKLTGLLLLLLSFFQFQKSVNV